MDSTLKKQLQEWAKEYNQPKYFQEDPCQFPHRFKKKQDSRFQDSWLHGFRMGKGNRLWPNAKSCTN